jgi:hypothetical protein
MAPAFEQRGELIELSLGRLNLALGVQTTFELPLVVIAGRKLSERGLERGADRISGRADDHHLERIPLRVAEHPAIRAFLALADEDRRGFRL